MIFIAVIFPRDMLGSVPYSVGPECGLIRLNDLQVRRYTLSCRQGNISLVCSMII